MIDKRVGTFHWVELPLRYRSWILAFYCLLASAAAPGILFLENDNSAEVFFPRSALVQKEYRQFTSSFGRDTAVRLAVSGPGLWTRRGLAWIGELERRVASVFGVIGVAGLVEHHSWRFPEWPPDAALLKNLALQDPLDRNAGWISRDGSIVTLHAALAKGPPGHVRKVLSEMQELVSHAPPGTESWIVGLPLIQQSLDQALWEFLVRYFPVLIILVIGLLLAVFRRPAHLVPPLLLVAVCELTVLGAMGYAGESLNMIVILLVPLVLVIALATATHVLLRFRHHLQRGLSSETAVREAFREKLWPVVWTGVTTAGAFGSLAASPVPPVRALGIWSALGISLVTVATLTFYPPLLALGKAGYHPLAATSFEQWGRKLGRRCAAWAIRRRSLVFLGFGVTAALWAGGGLQLSFDTSLRSYFREEQFSRWQIDRLEAGGVGVVAGELILGPDRTSDPVFAGNTGWKRLQELTSELRKHSAILGVVSAAEVMASLDQARDSVGGSKSLPQQAVSPVTRILPYLLTRDRSQARVSLLVPLRSALELEPVFDEAIASARSRFPQLPVRVTGTYPLVLAAQQKTLHTMLESLSIALLVVIVIFCLLLGKVGAGLKALLPNLWPLVFVLGALGWLAIPLDSTTVMIAAVALGLVVDDSLHTLGLFRPLAAVDSPERAAVSALQATAGAHCLTSLLLAGGFAVCALSSFVPVARFGAFMAAGIILALLGDLILMPALLAGRPRPGQRRA